MKVCRLPHYNSQKAEGPRPLLGVLRSLTLRAVGRSAAALPEPASFVTIVRRVTLLSARTRLSSEARFPAALPGLLTMKRLGSVQRKIPCVFVTEVKEELSTKREHQVQGVVACGLPAALAPFRPGEGARARRSRCVAFCRCRWGGVW